MATEPAPPPRRAWSAVAATTLGIFTVVTSELLPVGLLTPIADSLRISEGVAGFLVTVPGLLAAVTALSLPSLLNRLDRRIVLSGLLALLVIAHIATALAPHVAVVLVARFLVGVSIGGYWSIAGGLAVRLVPREATGRATSVIFSGVAAASVLGVPAGTLLGDLVGWRGAFWAMAGLSSAALIALATLLPTLPPTAAIRPATLPRLLRDNRGVRVGVIITGLMVAGHFSAFTYVRPLLQGVSGIAPGAIGALLIGYGIAGITGNFIVGTVAARHVRRAMLGSASGIAAVLVAFPLLGVTPVPGVIALLVWGVAYGGVSVTTQNWMLRAAPDAVEAATAANVAMFNLAIAFGAFAGGIAVDRLVEAAAWLGGGFTVLAALVVWRNRIQESK